MKPPVLPPSAPAPAASLDHILLFRTDIRSLKAKRRLSQLLVGLPIERWSVDTKDRDGVLRIVSAVLCPAEVIALLTRHGVQCAEL